MGRGSRQALYSLIAICVSNYPTSDLLESQDSSTDNDSDDSDNGSKTKSEFDGRPAQKKQKTDNSQHSRKGKSPPVSKNE
jgi:hypothetical protein